ncbi:GNAT family N-acetyltransferase [Sporosarcina cyprini]|uniref:GNAT family N-acetyltransferase n=1 Tax=Sporosarcina cyprini TaxID=2910523 RepID=UPI001EDDD8D7|nr:GNAT family N-acetyltransferase [Sporosarcina cyprini]MCG3087032.1 GNAT family N-acetyltransferase [Sporosarcina cyprini]
MIKELLSKNEILEAFPIMKQLRPHLNENSYVELVMATKESDGYRMFALFDKNTMTAVIGFKPMITLSSGRYVWICDLVTDQTIRSKGYGERLLTFVEEWAKENKFGSISLSSGLERTGAHRFYEEKMDYTKASYVYKKYL